MKWLALLLLFCALRLSAAVGDLIGLEVETNGWVLRATISGLNTNGNFFNGFGTNNSITGTQKLTLTVTSPGFSDSGTSNTINRTIYGTEILRAVYPMQNTNDIQPQGSDSVWRIALSEFVMSNDVVTASALSGYCAVTNGNGTNANAFAAQAVTNSSELRHPIAIANWSYPGLQRITNSTLTLRAVGYHRSAQSGRPLRAMRFVAQDEHGNAATNFVTAMSFERTFGDASLICEYIGQLDVSGFTNGDHVVCNFTAYPWVGDLNAVCDTFDGRFATGPSYAPQSNRCDRLGTWGVSYAVVATNGNDPTGVAVTNDVWSAPFLTIGGAMNALVKSNAIWFGQSRSNLSGSTIHLVEGKHAWLGVSPTFGDFGANPAVVITGYPTNVSKPEIQQSLNYTDSRHKRYHLKGVFITFTNGGFGFSAANTDYMWLENCAIDTLAAGPFTATTNAFVTQCSVTNLVGFTGSSFTPTLLRGNFFYSTNDVRIQSYTQIGNSYLSVRSGALVQAIAATETLSPVPFAPIIAYNKFRGIWLGSAAAVNVFNATICTNGAAFVQNEFENFDKDGSVNGTAFSSGSAHATNILIWLNTIAGTPTPIAYNDTGSSAVWKMLLSVKGNLFDLLGVKSDTFVTGNGLRIGNWSAMFGVGWSGNVSPQYAETAAIFPQDFAGLSSYHALLNLTNYFQWRNMQSSSRSLITRSGLGDYRLKNSSPVFGINVDWVLPYDLEGNARSASDPPGAYVARAMPFSLIGKAGWSGKGGAQ